MSNEERATYREILRLNDLLRESRPMFSLMLRADESGDHLQAVGLDEFTASGWVVVIPLSSDFEEVRRRLGDMVAAELAKRGELAF